MSTPPTPTRFRRGAAWVLDAVVIGLPALLIGVVVPIVPVGLAVWVTYRLWAAWTGNSIGRYVARIRIARKNNTAPRHRGIIHATLASLPYAVATISFAVPLTTISLTPWYLWLMALPLIIAASVALAVLTASILWSGGPRLDRWSGIAAQHTRLATHGSSLAPTTR